MVGSLGRIYLADSKNTVRQKTGLAGKDRDEDFAKFQRICHNVYHFKSDFRPEVAWKDGEGFVIAAAATEVLEMCRRDGVDLGIGGALSDEMIEWRLHQLHRTAQKTHERRRKQSGGTGVCD